MSNEVYEVTVADNGPVIRVAAKSKAAAKKFALSGVQVRRLSGAEVIALNEAGIAIGTVPEPVTV